MFSMLNDWEFDELKRNMTNMTLYQLQELYIKEKDAYLQACVNLVVITKPKEDIETQKEYCEILEKRTIIIALEIAERLVN